MINIILPGEPQGKERPRFVKRGDYMQPYTPQKTKDYEEMLWLAFNHNCPHGFEPLQGAIVINIKAFMGIPKSAPEKKKELMRKGAILPTKKPDVDNIAKIVCDALQQKKDKKGSIIFQGVYHDDKQIIALFIEKKYSDIPRIEIEIDELKEDLLCHT